MTYPPEPKRSVRRQCTFFGHSLRIPLKPGGCQKEVLPPGTISGLESSFSEASWRIVTRPQKLIESPLMVHLSRAHVFDIMVHLEVENKGLEARRESVDGASLADTCFDIMVPLEVENKGLKAGKESVDGALSSETLCSHPGACGGCN